MATTRKVILRTGPHFGGWRAKVHGQPELVADSIAELSSLVRDVIGDRAWQWKLDLGQDTDWYIQLAKLYHERHGEGMLSNEQYRDQLAEAVWALGLYEASAEDAAAIIGVPLDWVRRVWPPPQAYQN